MKISICCCNYLFGEGLKSLIEREGPDTWAVVNCADPREVIEARADLLIIDSGNFSCLSPLALSGHKMGILLLGGCCLPKVEDDRLMHLLSGGLVGVLTPNTNSSQFRKAILSVLSGELWLDRKQVRHIISKESAKKKAPSFTRGELEVIKLIYRGYCNKEIMHNLNLSEDAVKSHLKRIYKKSGVSGRLELVAAAVNHLPNVIA
jgi:DNA-binding NarL/FixJ family response regulator